MPRRHDDLFHHFANFQALRRAALRAVRGKRRKPGAAAFMANLEGELLRLERELLERRYRPGGYVTIRVRDPKPRLVSAAPFRDRVVHHALCAVIEPLFERGFIHDSYANRLGKGTHRAIARYERFRDRHAHVLRCDIHRYFPAVDHAVLKADVRRRICCENTLWLVDRIIDGSNRQEPVNAYYPGDDLFAPFERRRGLPIGNLTSQFFANIYLDRLDHFCKEVLRAGAYLRYVDDFALFHDDPAVLGEWRRRIAEHLARRRLSLHPVKTFIAPTGDPAVFLGFELLAGGYRRLPEANLRRFRNRLRGLRDRWRAGTLDRADIENRIGAWIAHAEHADTWRLRQAIFRGGWFDPSNPSPREPDRPPGAVFFAAAPGTTNRGTCARPTATGTGPRTGTTTTDSVSPARMIAGTEGSKDPSGAPACVQGRS
ncbi:MAG: RNA-directed DNA polymerase [Alphaproteobacteria bacterium]|jgi:retron-type reverse transcriptase|nr:RNA-directed DNA polymerase [Alphaproteobacteria bacterium]MDP6816369.1 RNA-directed DNA polymerase [Alphaproteobacteria bacterium]